MTERFEYKFDCRIIPGKASIERFGEIHQAIANENYKEIILDLTKYKYIHPSFAVLIASSLYLGDLYNKKVSIKYSKTNDKLTKFLKQSGIEAHYNKSKVESSEFNIQNASVKFNHFSKLEDTEQTINNILDTAPISLSQDLRDRLISKFTEIFSNAFTHGKSKIGVFCCGFINDSNIFSFSVYDAGIGICTNVNTYLDEDKSCDKALEWAFAKTHSTLNGIVDYPRGAGLNLLESFVKANEGRIDLSSEGAYGKIDSTSRNFYNLINPIIGTIFSLSIKADNKHIYILK